MTSDTPQTEEEKKTELTEAFVGPAAPLAPVSEPPANESEPAKTTAIPIKTILSQAQRMGIGPYKKRVRI